MSFLILLRRYQWIWHLSPFSWSCLFFLLPSQLTIGFSLLFSLTLFSFFIFFIFILIFFFFIYFFLIHTYWCLFPLVILYFFFLLKFTQRFNYWFNCWLNHQLLFFFTYPLLILFHGCHPTTGDAILSCKGIG